MLVVFQVNSSLLCCSSYFGVLLLANQVVKSPAVYYCSGVRRFVEVFKNYAE